MTLIIVLLLILSYLLIATGHLTGVNKSAIAIFLAAIGWVVYICWGTDFVMALHPGAYAEFLGDTEASSQNVKNFIYDSIFLKYVGKAAAIVMYLLATMSIIEILNNNGCFDFIGEWIRTRNSKRLLWTITLATFILSANLDNLTTTIVMLIIMRDIVKSRPQRMLIGSAIMLAAICGGCFTVIGDPTGLILWSNEAVTATHFSSYLVLPAITAWVVPTIFINRQLPSRLDIEWIVAPFRGDDTRLNRWQRILMLIVAIGGLWFVPTFLSITRLPAFLGALVVLGVLWVVNEAFNRKLINTDQMSRHRVPRVIQYEAYQQLLFVMGIMLGIGVIRETGVLANVADWIDSNIDNLWVVGILSGLLSCLVDSFTIAVSDIAFYDVWNAGDYAQNGAYWKVIAYCTAVGGCLLSVGSASGMALMKMEHIHLGWYFKNITFKVFLGWLVGLAILWAEIYFVS
ncbi:MAG: sodium:proton antiporter NhaD [Prevotella sp.]|nr:sodium:proton antiporter NhaD [Prevotella sp.]MDE6011704.1 sodium:proton antiporter NhaD [Prevotella sp.]MDE7088906.1 sodium:proton antiporter NhaD [Prevotella sp.]